MSRIRTRRVRARDQRASAGSTIMHFDAGTRPGPGLRIVGRSASDCSTILRPIFCPRSLILPFVGIILLRHAAE